MNPNIVELLRCPECRQGFTFFPVDQPDAPERTYGVLECSCFAYPVVDGVPIIRKTAVEVQEHTRGDREVAGPLPEELTALIRRQAGLEALLRLIVFPVQIPTSGGRFRPDRAALRIPTVQNLASARRKVALRRRLMSNYDHLAAEDWFDLFYFRSPCPEELFYYFYYRFGQPRHLAALSLMTIFPASDKPLLDVACGFGHLAHYLNTCGNRHSVIGFDRNFFQLWVGKHWIAPATTYVCSDADVSLPFRDGVFSGVLCSDAFHLFQDKSGCLNELRRCAEGSPMVLTRIGNELVKPNEGSELSPAAYSELLHPSDHRLVGETELIASYLLGKGPQLAKARHPEALNGEKWLSIIVGSAPGILRDHGEFEIWPHAAGQLRVNPIYVASGRDGNGDALFTFRFPSEWYAFENKQMRDYHPSSVTISEEALEQIERGVQTPQVRELIEQFVVLGVPSRYMRSQVEPGKSS